MINEKKNIIIFNQNRKKVSKHLIFNIYKKKFTVLRLFSQQPEKERKKNKINKYKIRVRRLIIGS